MTRWWTETVAAVGDAVPLSLVALLLLLGAGLTAAGWYWFPAWVPRRLPRWRLRRPRVPRLRRTRVAVDARPPEEPMGGDELPDLPVAEFLSLADRLAAQGRYAEAVRERLRAMIRELVDRQVIEHRPGWTIGELAVAAGTARPAVDPSLRAAGTVFSDLWYGQRAAGQEHDARMRHLADELHLALSTRNPGGAP